MQNPDEATDTCEICKTAHATLHLTAVEGGKPFERHFCETCARTAATEKVDFFPFRAGAGPPAWIEDQKKRLLCPACGHRNQDDWKFCSACGAKRGP